MNIKVKGYIHHKEAESYSDCVDRYGFNNNTNKFAISDGVTSSFFPGIWADLLISEFIDKAERVNVTDVDYLKLIQTTWFNKVKEIAENSSKWVLRKNFNDRRPALTTFVGLHFFYENGQWLWEASALGDSFLFFVPDLATKFSFDAEQKNIEYLSSKTNLDFDNYPDYFASDGSNKGIVKTRNDKVSSGTFLLMTDALSEWFIREKEQAFETIKLWNSHSDFIDSIESLRRSNRLHNDDCAILILTVKTDQSHKINYELMGIDRISELTETDKRDELKTKEESTSLSQSIDTFESNDESGNAKQEVNLILNAGKTVNKEEKYIITLMRTRLIGPFKRKSTTDENKSDLPSIVSSTEQVKGVSSENQKNENISDPTEQNQDNKAFKDIIRKF